MLHPFKDTLIVFIGTPQRCTRHAARVALSAVGGITDERIAAFTSYVVAFANAEKTKMYQTALEREEQGFLTILTEAQFFDILNDGAEPPDNPKRNADVTVIPPKDPEAYACELERMKTTVLNHKRMRNLAKYGVSTPEGSMKVDLQLLEALCHYSESQNAQSERGDE